MKKFLQTLSWTLLLAGTTQAAGLQFSTFLGGPNEERGQALALDGSGNAFVSGYTQSSDFPTTSGTFSTSIGGGGDVFVTKLSSTGSSLSYSTFLGGSRWDSGYALALDGSGNAFVSGHTSSSNFPTTGGAFSTSYNGGNSDVFVTKLSSTGSSLSYSTFLGGSSWDDGYALALDGSGNAFVSGYTKSNNFPTTGGAFSTSYNGGNRDVFVTKLSSTGSSLSYSTFLGGSSDDRGYALAIDGSGNAFVSGYTLSSNFPTTGGTFKTSYNGGNGEVFVTKLSSTGSSLSYSTFLGG